MEKKDCENLPKCGFFFNFKGNTEVIKNGWIRLYCNDLVRSETCERKKFGRANGIAPPDNMTPLGKIIKS